MAATPSIWKLREVTQTGSTNTDLLRSAEAGEIGYRTVLRTDHQTAGRGRLDRRWDAPAGANLLASMYLDVAASKAVDAMHRVGLAVVNAVTELESTDSTVGLKWPNDVLLQGTKLAGVLAQQSTSAPGIVVGFGVNVGWAPPGAARVHDLDTSVTPASLLERVLVAFDALPDDISTLYRARLQTLGRRVRVELPGSVNVSGQAIGVDAGGRLMVRLDDGQIRAFDVGDVVHLRSAI
ncbi:MAG: biotin--[acetyl-CoA-carboxylase] ligase [Actinomycetota bacterium]|uniref:biotin--[acetyl-CoA-carboxylase] ligase n=1 Tax=uncultured Ilumatobacter sp. TaxID=879968 RepID=UPI00374F827A|nr:biotin--[acetyl-CoA-carboxylase] ligase [Actinomycetota bacterium]